MTKSKDHWQIGRNYLLLTSPRAESLPYKELLETEEQRVKKPTEN